jgi:hypothetical protein
MMLFLTSSLRLAAPAFHGLICDTVLKCLSMLLQFEQAFLKG